MIQINKHERQFLEEIGILAPVKGNYNEQMTISCVGGKSKKKSIYVHDYLIIYINPEHYMRLMKPYLSMGFIKEQIRQSKLYLQGYKKNQNTNKG